MGMPVSCSLRLVVVALLAAATSGIGLPIQNPSFEDGYTLAVGGLTGAHASPIPGWVYAGAAWGAGLINPMPADPQATSGQNVLWSNGGAVEQTLTDVVMAGIYTLTVDVASIPGGEPPYIEADYSIELLANGSVVGSSVLPPLSASIWQVATVTASFGPGDAEIGGTLGIRLGSDRPQGRFDNVALSYVIPEPASLVCLLTGGLPLLLRGRGNRRLLARRRPNLGEKKA
jgi:hypothetical protein